MKVNFKGKDIEIKMKKVSFLGKIRGLMFRGKNTKNLFFELSKFDKKIHSYFVFFNFLALWLDKNNNVIRADIVKPFRFSIMPEKRAKFLIEIPFNKKNKRILELLVGKRKDLYTS
jgi:uncharacterized membrane protein (UPF0127 family)